jgi:hypothetical protein
LFEIDDFATYLAFKDLRSYIYKTLDDAIKNNNNEATFRRDLVTALQSLYEYEEKTVVSKVIEDRLWNYVLDHYEVFWFDSLMNGYVQSSQPMQEAFKTKLLHKVSERYISVVGSVISNSEAMDDGNN